MTMTAQVRQLVVGLCQEAVRIHRALDNTGSDPRAFTARMEWWGQLHGIHAALCLIHGWDAAYDTDKEGPADELVQKWWEQRYPDDW